MSKSIRDSTKIVKKQWLPVRADGLFKGQTLGECYVASPQNMVGRTLTASMANITGDIKKQSISLKFRIGSADEEGGMAVVVGYSLAPSMIKRIVRRGSDRIDETLTGKTKDGKKVQIKPMLVTRSSAHSSVRQALRKALVNLTGKYVGSLSFDALIGDIISAKMQLSLKSELKRVYPLKSFEVRALYVFPDGGEKSENANEEAAEGPNSKEKV